MARVEIPIVVLNSTTGLPVVGAAVAVTVRATGNPATWYTAETGGTGSTAAIVTDAAGRVSAWVPRGAYNLAVSGTGITSYTEPWDAVPGADGTIDTLWLGAGVAAAVIATEIIDPYTVGPSTSFEIGSVAATHNGKTGKVFLVAYADVLSTPFSVNIRRGGTIVHTPSNPLTSNTSGLVCAAYSFSALSGAQTWSVTIDTGSGGFVSSSGTGLLVVVEQ